MIGSSTVRPTRCRYRSSSGCTATRGVAQHGLHPGGGDHDRIGRFAIDRAVADRHQLAGVLGVIDLDVGQRGATTRAPVDDPLGAVDQAVVVHPLEDGLHGGGQAVVQGEPLAAPVDGIAEPLHLAEDRAAVLLLPVPDLLHEQVPAEIVLGLAVDGEPALDQGLGGDPGVVHPGQPEHLVPGHPVPAGQDVHQRVVEGVPDVQVAGDVRRRQHDRERPLRAAEHLSARRRWKYPAANQRWYSGTSTAAGSYWVASSWRGGAECLGSGGHRASLGAARRRTNEPTSASVQLTDGGQ